MRESQFCVHGWNIARSATKRRPPAWRQAVLLLAVIALSASIAAAQRRLSAPRPVVNQVKGDVAPAVAQHLGTMREQVGTALKRGERFPGLAKAKLRVKGFQDPWAAMAMLENHGLQVAGAAGTRSLDVASVVDRLAAALDRPPGETGAVVPASGSDLEALARWITAVFDQAREQHERAVAGIPKKHRAFMVEWAPRILTNYGPQVEFNERVQPILQNDLTFVGQAHEGMDWKALLGTFRTLSVFASPQFAQKVKAACYQAPARRATVPGVNGKIFYEQKTPYGWILVGGKGKNVYAVEEPVAIIVDPGGDDEYEGRVASNADLAHPFGVVVDLAGRDRYTGDKLGLATGRLGVGLLCDRAGDDTYRLEEGTGGVGLAGVGVLFDVAGNDTYRGSRFTHGVGLGGIGLLFDVQGNDTYTAFGYGVGFGGSGGVGALVDAAGDDSYQCGKKYPSGYNSLVKPIPKPGDPRFQWTAFGMGMGLGRRIVGSRDINEHRFALAGGVGMVVDLTGDDRYESSNFSQGCGYYFGAGLLLDLAGDDVHGAARYGHASGAHFGMGLFVDYAGKDQYTSTGPTYNGGCSWDHSIFLAVDAGPQGDHYDLTRSAGPGQADIGSWGVFADLGGADTYALRRWPGQASRTGIGVFFDRAGNDTYDFQKKKAGDRPENKKLRVTKEGGMFWDRK